MAKRKIGKVPVDHIKTLGLFLSLKEREDLKRKDGVCGYYNADYREIEYDPDHATEETIIHEAVHAYRHAHGILEEEAKDEEPPTNMTEQSVVDFIVNNPKLARWLVDRLVARAKKHTGR